MLIFNYIFQISCCTVYVVTVNAFVVLFRRNAGRVRLLICVDLYSSQRNFFNIFVSFNMQWGYDGKQYTETASDHGETVC